MAYDSDLPPPTFELESYANNYEGPFVPLRLAYITTRCPSLARQSLTLAIAAARKSKDVGLYSRLHDIASRLGLQDLAAIDTAWVSKQEEQNKREQARLESELKGYKNNMIRESIRMGQEDLAVHFLLSGGPPLDPANPAASGLNAAYSAYNKMRDYCTTPTHVASMTLRLIYTALLQAVSARQMAFSATTHLNAALANCGRLRTVGVKDEEMQRLVPIMHAASGIANLGLSEYRNAALAFLAVPHDYATPGPVHGTDFTRSVASPNDIAIYGGLCALATMNREELLTHVLGGGFRFFLELEPHMRKAISLFTTAKYQACLATLRRYHSDWSLDVFLGSHVDRLFAHVRQKSIIAYFSSFSQVSLASLAETFPPSSVAISRTSPVQALETEVLSLIHNGALDARLDAVDGLLVAPVKETRSATHGDAKAAAEEVERTLLLRLHRVNCVLANVEVPRSKATGQAQFAGS